MLKSVLAYVEIVDNQIEPSIRGTSGHSSRWRSYGQPKRKRLRITFRGARPCVTNERASCVIPSGTASVLATLKASIEKAVVSPPCRAATAN
jgi:hypothetical protein